MRWRRRTSGSHEASAALWSSQRSSTHLCTPGTGPSEHSGSVLEGSRTAGPAPDRGRNQPSVLPRFSWERGQALTAGIRPLVRPPSVDCSRHSEMHLSGLQLNLTRTTRAATGRQLVHTGGA